ncbi:MAG: hypothetical protein AAGD96_26860 [Chloroflexota bacterium]
MDVIFTLHEGLENALWIFFLAIGLWGTYNAVQGEGIDGSWIGAFFIGMGLIVIQAILAGVLWFGGPLAGLEDPGIHFLYVAFSVVFPPFIYQIVLQGDDSNRGMWVMAFTALFMFGIAIRLMNTAVLPV